MGVRGEYDFLILVVALVILALQVHNPFMRPECKCSCTGADAPAADLRAPPTVSARPATGRPTGMSSDELLDELTSIKAEQRAQAEALRAQPTYAPAGQGAPGGQPAQQYPPQYGQPYGQPAQAPQAPQAPGAPGAPGAGSLIASRDQLGQLLQQLHPQGVGVCLGVGKGDGALALFRQWRTTPGLYLVDPYIHIWQGYDDPENLSDKEHQYVYETLRNRLADEGFEGRYVLVRDFSYSFAATYKTGDAQQPAPALVWIDANHAYEAVQRDLQEWWPLVPSGGVVAGSTFLNDPARKIGVRQAVEDFARPLGLQVHETREPNPTFVIIKP